MATPTTAGRAAGRSNQQLTGKRRAGTAMFAERPVRTGPTHLLATHLLAARFAWLLLLACGLSTAGWSPLGWSPWSAPTASAQTAGTVFAQPASSSNWFENTLGEIQRSLGALIPELRGYHSHLAVQSAIGQLYQVEADSRALAERTRRGEAYESVAAAYQQLNTRWRDAAYRLRSGGEIAPQLTQRLNGLDENFRSIDRRLGLSPPIDRVRLRDLMIVTLTYMDALFDDIRLSQGYTPTAESLLSQGRLLRERLRQESYRMDQADHDEIVNRFMGFVQQWRPYNHSLQQLNNVHINQRLESIRRQGEEVMATLRIPAAADRNDLLWVAERLPGELRALSDQLANWGTYRLTNNQFRFMETCVALAERARRLAQEVGRSGASPAAQDLFREMNQRWVESLQSMIAIDPASGLQASLAQVNSTFTSLGELLRVQTGTGRTELLNLAASLEASAENFQIDVQRFARQIEPLAYRQALTAASDHFYATARRFHSQIAQRTDQSALAATVRQLESQWNALTPLVNDLSGRGLASARAELIFTNYRELQPLVMQATTILGN